MLLRREDSMRMSFSAMTYLGLHWGLSMLTLSRMLNVTAGLSLCLALHHASCHVGCPYRLLICCLHRASCTCAEYTKPAVSGSAKPLPVGPSMKTQNSGQLNKNLHISFRKLLLRSGCHDLLCQMRAGLSRMQSLCGHKNSRGIITIYRPQAPPRL